MDSRFNDPAYKAVERRINAVERKIRRNVSAERMTKADIIDAIMERLLIDARNHGYVNIAPQDAMDTRRRLMRETKQKLTVILAEHGNA